MHTRSFTSWQYESQTLETLDVEDVLLPILNVFQDKTDLINRVKEELNLNVRVYLVINIVNGHTPGMTISPELSKLLSSIDAPLGIDMHVYSFSELEE